MENGLFSSTTPFTPPTTEDGRLSWLRLIRSGRVGPGSFQALLREHGSAEAALAALPAIAARAGLADYSPCSAAAAKAELRSGYRAGLRLLLSCDSDYPPALLQLKDAPPVLWVAGLVGRLSAPAVAIVGTRNASGAGLRIAEELASELAARGYMVVSGLARGIDRAAHEGAGPAATIAVLPGGAAVVSPREHQDLARRIAGGGGALISEHPPGLSPQAHHFAQRNRLISGLSGGVVVVEAALRSGSLITARDALDQGREVMAVPGHPIDPRAAGCNQLLRDGARLIRHAEDVIEALGGAPACTIGPAVPLANTRGGGAIARSMAAAARRLLARPPAATPHRPALPAPELPAATPDAGAALPALAEVSARPQALLTPPAETPAAGALTLDRPAKRIAAPLAQAAPPAPAAGPVGPASPARPCLAAPAAPDATSVAAATRASGTPQPPACAPLTPLQRRILRLLSQAPLSASELGHKLRLPERRIGSELLTLELSDHLERRSGGLHARRL